jgi:hypothetical protein
LTGNSEAAELRRISPKAITVLEGLYKVLNFMFESENMQDYRVVLTVEHSMKKASQSTLGSVTINNYRQT